MFFTFVLFLSAAGSNAQRAFRLVRERQIPGDDFLLPKATPDCPRNGAVYVPLCSKYNAALLGGCWCQCNKPANRYTFYEPSNGCVKASIARQKSECDLLFSDETVDSYLRFFSTSSARKKAINVPVNQRCSFYYGDNLHAQYLGCDGAWNEIPTQNVVDGLDVTPGWSESRLNIMVKTGATFLQNHAGRIFRVAVQCRNQNESRQARSTCLLFKVEGTINCPIPQQNISRPSATLPPPSPITTLPPVTTGSTEKPTTSPSSTNNTEVCKCPELLPFLKRNCTNMTTGMVRFINDSGHSILQVCSKNQWKSYVPQCHPLKGCDNKQIAGLVGHWRMDEQSGNEVADDSGHENHGFANGPVPMLSKFSRGRYFVSAGVITVPNTASLNFGNSGFSVVGWVKILDVRYPLTTFAAKKGFGCYFGPAQPGGLPGWEIGQGYRDNGIRLCVRDNGNRVASKVIVFDDGYQPAQLLKQWVHYAVVFDREQQRKVYVYINGKKQSNTLDIPTVQGSVDNTRPLEFGYSYGWKTKGIMDEYRVYNIALDDYEVVSIYESHLV